MEKVIVIQSKSYFKTRMITFNNIGTNQVFMSNIGLKND